MRAVRAPHGGSGGGGAPRDLNADAHVAGWVFLLSTPFSQLPFGFLGCLRFEVYRPGFYKPPVLGSPTRLVDLPFISSLSDRRN